MAVVDSSEFMRSGFDSTIFIILPSPHAASASSIPTIQRTSTCTIEEKRGGRVSWLGAHTRETSGTKHKEGWGNTNAQSSKEGRFASNSRRSAR